MRVLFLDDQPVVLVIELLPESYQLSDCGKLINVKNNSIINKGMSWMQLITISLLENQLG